MNHNLVNKIHYGQSFNLIMTASVSTNKIATDFMR